MSLDHTKLDVYHRALDLLDLLDRIDILDRRRQVPADRLQPIQDVIVRVVSMLTKLATK